MQLDPLNCQAKINWTMLRHVEGHSGEAHRELDPCLKQSPNWFAGWVQLGYLDIYDNHPDEGLAHLQHADTIAPGTPFMDAGFAIAYAESGRRPDALARFQQMESQADAKGYARYGLALISAYLGDRDRLFYWLGQSIDSYEQQALSMRIDPSLKDYQQDARMLDLEKRIGLR